MNSIRFASRCYTRVSNDRFIATLALFHAIRHERIRFQYSIKLYAFPLSSWFIKISLDPGTNTHVNEIPYGLLKSTPS